MSIDRSTVTRVADIAAMAFKSSVESWAGVESLPETSRAVLRSALDLVAPNSAFSNLAPSDVPRLNGLQSISPNYLPDVSGRFNYTVLDDGSPGLDATGVEFAEFAYEYG